MSVSFADTPLLLGVYQKWPVLLDSTVLLAGREQLNEETACNWVVISAME